MSRDTTQPTWKLVANLGDVNPIEYGGYFVYVDETGVYPPEAELLESPDDDIDPSCSNYVVYRFILDPCTYVNGVLSDNPFHPDKPAWFATRESERVNRPQDTTYLSRVSDYTGMGIDGLIALFTSDDPCERAEAYRAIGDYHGFDNLDSYPLRLTRAEAEARYSAKV